MIVVTTESGPVYVTGNKKDDGKYKGMHNGTVKGKSFERSRRNRKSHHQRRMDHVMKARNA